MHIYLLRSLTAALFLERQLLLLKPFYSLAYIHHSGLFACEHSSTSHCTVGRHLLKRPLSYRVGHVAETQDLMISSVLGTGGRILSTSCCSSYCIMVSTSVIGSLRIHGLAEYWIPYICGVVMTMGFIWHIHQMLHS